MSGHRKGRKMPLIGCSFYILGAVMICAIEAQTPGLTTVMTLNDNTIKLDNASIGMNLTTSETPVMSATSNMTTMRPTMNATYSMTTKMMEKGNQTTKAPMTAKTMPTAPRYTTVKSPKPTPSPQSGDSTGIIILIIIILVALVFGVACYVARRRGRRYSVDFNSRQDEANIPLSTVDPQLPIDATPENGLQTFESVETTALEPQEPEAKAEEDKEEQKAEADKSGEDAPSAESAAAPGPSADASEDKEDKPKEDKAKEDTAQPGPPAPAEVEAEEKTDDEGVASSKTSVESLKDTNENNSNNAGVTRKVVKLTGPFWEVPLDSPV